jgi:hypothetical protein
LRRERKIIAAANEAEIYGALGLQYIEPELREGLDEIERAAAHEIPPLVTAADLRGVLHAHTTASDGADTLEAMAEASLALGYQYIGISDHSKTAHYAGGLTIEEIEQRRLRSTGSTRRSAATSASSRASSPTSFRTAHSIIPKTCCAASISSSAAFTGSSASNGRRRPNASCAQFPTHSSP